MHARSVRGILDGRKTQTRRIIKGAPEFWIPEVGVYAPTLVSARGEEYPGPEVYGASDESHCARCPYGQPGDRLWVRETWGYHGTSSVINGGDDEEANVARVSYHADGARREVPFPNFEAMHQATPNQNLKFPDNYDDLEDWQQNIAREDLLSAWWKRQRKRPSIYMPRWACRLVLEVISVRVERVQDISEADAWAEGVTCPEPVIRNPRGAFRRLWDDTNGAGAWDRNDWTWVVEFKRTGN